MKKELRKRTCRVCHQYIPSAYRMKNHYKIHAQNFDELNQDKEEDETISSGKECAKKIHDSFLNPTSSVNSACKTEMLDWLRGDFDQVNINSASKSSTKPTTNDEEEWVHLD